MNVTNFKNEVSETAKKIKEQIKDEIKNKILSLKIDSVTRFNRGILVINIQFLNDDNEIVVRTLSMKELHAKHIQQITSNALFLKLAEYEITLKQIYSVTSDTGANMIKTVKLLRLEVKAAVDCENECDDNVGDDDDDDDEEDKRTSRSTN